MKIKKGNAGYIESRKRQVILKTVVEFGIVIALLVALFIYGWLIDKGQGLC